MNQELNARTVILILLAVLAIAANVYIYFWLVRPANDSLENVKMQAETERKIVDELEQRLHSATSGPIFTSTDLQRSVPVKPLVDQFILDLERAEIVADSIILNYKFTSGSFEGMGITQASTEGGEEEGTAEDNNGVEEELTAGDDAAETEENLPAGIERVMVELEVYSPTYNEMLKFLSEIEKQKRVKKIDASKFNGNEEVTIIEGDDEEVEGLFYNVTISAFYLPELQYLIDELPKMNYPRPANKKSPLYNDQRL